MDIENQESVNQEPVDDSPLLHVKIMTIGEVATLAKNSEVRNKRVAVIGCGFAGHLPALIHAISQKHPDIDVVVMEKAPPVGTLLMELDEEMLREQMPKKFEITRLEMPMAEVYVKPHDEGQPWKGKHQKNSHHFNNKHNFKGAGRGRNNFKNRRR